MGSSRCEIYNVKKEYKTELSTSTQFIISQIDQVIKFLAPIFMQGSYDYIYTALGVILAFISFI